MGKNFSMEDAMALARSRQGQQLLSMARQAGGRELQKAAESGDVEKVKKALSGLLESPDFRALMHQLEDRHG